MYYLSSVLVENIIVKNIVIVNLFFNAVQVGSMGRGGGLFQYLSKINYDKMINCEQWKDKLCVILCII